MIVLGVIAGLVVLILVVALFVRKAYAITRSITILKPQPEVFQFVKHLKNQARYSKWVMVDPNMKTDFRGTDGTVGFIYAWEGNKQAGKGEQEIKSITPERMDLEIRFEKPFEGVAQTPFLVEPLSENQTRVTWGMRSQMKYPMNIMLLFMNIEKILGKDLEDSLGNLKTVLER